jgi:uncharacterized protein YndB with AHSA1/START domain
MNVPNLAQDFTATFIVDQPPEEVFAAINNVRGWWGGWWSSEIEGDTDALGAEFTYNVAGVHYCKMAITDFVPRTKVAWHVLESDIAFAEDRTEWNGTDIVFDIEAKDGKTEVRFTHKGLVPAYQCYDNCSNAWGMLINGSLRKMIITGQAPDKSA